MKVVAQTRQTQGSGASRRLRRAAKVPGILYGGNATPTMIELDHNPLYHALRVESFHASILDMELDGQPERVLLRAVQWHPYKPVVQHIDFQRVAADQKIVLKVPLHFVNQENSPAVKLSAAIISHVITEITVSCLPADLQVGQIDRHVFRQVARQARDRDLGDHVADDRGGELDRR